MPLRLLSILRNKLPKQLLHINLTELRHNGTPEILIGTTILSILAYDHYLQHLQSNQKQKEHNAKRIILDRLQRDVAMDAKWHAEKMTTDDASSSSVTKEALLYRCEIKRLPVLFDGSMSLMGVDVGEVVEVVEETVGPDGGYHLCRAGRGEEGGRMGWFPISHLERLDEDDGDK